MSKMARIRWQCRRGTRELDQVLMRYLDTRFEHLSESQRLDFQKLLEVEDNHLMALFFGEFKDDLGSHSFKDVVADIKKHVL